MAAEIGHFSLLVAFLISITQSVLPLIGAHRSDAGFMSFANWAAVTKLFSLSLAFGCLIYSFLISDFSLAVVAANSNSAMPTIYKISAVWGNHEGSLLLWVLILAIFGASVALFGGNLPDTLKARVIAVQGMIATGFLAVTIFTSNPFTRIDPAPFDGAELNPLLQDFGLAIHPPFLYLGYVGFSITFAFAIAALIEGRIDASWARFVRPWVLAAWCFLTIGITLGSYWAYYELGWGGWWFWDPVENASFMPWLVGTALLHSALVAERRQALITWTILLAILTFSLSLLGTFLVRSGVLTSVHAFATDPVRGMGVLILLFTATGGGLALFAWRSRSLGKSGMFALISREGGLVFNNILLVTATGCVFLGTFYPLFIDVLNGEKISVGPPYFNRTFVPLMIPLLLVMVVGPMLRWKRDNLKRAIAGLALPAILTILTFFIFLIIGLGTQVGPAFGMALAVWLVAGSLIVLSQRVRLFSSRLATSVRLARNTPRSVYGMILAHAGMGLAVAGITAVSSWQEERIVALAPGEKVVISQYEFTLDRIVRVKGPNFTAEQGRFTITRDGQVFANMTSERRLYTVRQTVTTEAGIKINWFSNLYVALGEGNNNGKWTVRLYYHPLALLIWFGPLLMAFGGFVSLSDRRFRIGIPQRTSLRPSTVGA